MVDLLVTTMETTAAPSGLPLRCPLAGLVVAREPLARAEYLSLYRAVGGPWRWDQRLRMAPAALDAYLATPTSDVTVLRLDGEAVGLCEIDRAQSPDFELLNFGLVPAAQGRRLGPFLLDQVLRAAFAHAPRRVWLHTDTWDHPNAQATYARAGFRVVRQRIECVDDL